MPKSAVKHLTYPKPRHEAPIHHITGEPILNFDWITSKIAIGTNACCQIHFDRMLIKKGVLADVSLEAERIDAAGGVDYFLWLPTKDKYPPTQRQLIVGADFINKMIKLHQPVYVHCRFGHQRAPSLVAAYLIAYKNMTAAWAFKYIKSKRPVIHPNKRQQDALKKFEQTWRIYQKSHKVAGRGRTKARSNRKKK